MLNSEKNNPAAQQLANKLMRFLGNTEPSKKQLRLLETLLLNTSLKVELLFNQSLTEKEKACLSLAALGQTSCESAVILGVSRHTIERHRKSIKEKLKCKNMTQAVMQGIRYGYLSPAKIERVNPS